MIANLAQKYIDPTWNAKGEIIKALEERDPGHHKQFYDYMANLIIAVCNYLSVHDSDIIGLINDTHRLTRFRWGEGEHEIPEL